MAMKKTVGYWNIDLDLTCPYCGEYLDEDNLMEGYDFLVTYKGKAECTNCKKKFFVEI